MFIKYFVIAVLKLCKSGMMEFEIIMGDILLHYSSCFWGGCVHPDGVDKFLEAGFGHLAVPLQGGPSSKLPQNRWIPTYPESRAHRTTPDGGGASTGRMLPCWGPLPLSSSGGHVPLQGLRTLQPGSCQK